MSTKLPTPYGWTTVGALQSGSSVFDEVGYPVFVKSVSAPKTEKVYRVGFTAKHQERGSLLMSEGQILNTWNRDQLQKFTRDTGIKTIPTDWAEHDGIRRPLSEVKENLIVLRGGYQTNLQHVIPVSFPLVLPHRDVPIPPYIMGVAVQIHDPYTGLMTCKEHMWDWYERQFLTAGLGLSRTKARLKRYRPNADVIFSSAELNRLLSREHGYNRGLIPDAYLRGSIQQRMELLTGLLDVPVSLTRSSNARVVCRNEAQADQITELIRSLGYAGIKYFEHEANCYVVKYSPLDNPYRYPKFRTELISADYLTRNTFIRLCWRIQSVELDSEAEVRSFEVTSPSGMVVVGDLFLPVVAT